MEIIDKLFDYKQIQYTIELFRKTSVAELRSCCIIFSTINARMADRSIPPSGGINPLKALR